MDILEKCVSAQLVKLMTHGKHRQIQITAQFMISYLGGTQWKNSWWWGGGRVGSAHKIYFTSAGGVVMVVGRCRGFIHSLKSLGIVVFLTDFTVLCRCSLSKRDNFRNVFLYRPHCPRAIFVGHSCGWRYKFFPEHLKRI